MFRVSNYKSSSELYRAHPEIKSLTVLYAIPRGQTADGIITALRKKNAQGNLYQIGNFIWQPSSKPCVCLKAIGDNGYCEAHPTGAQ